MQTKRRVIIPLVISFIFLISLSAFAQQNTVKGYEVEEDILEHNQLPLDPYPPFGYLTGYITYPNQFYGSKNFRIDKKKIKILVAENEYLKIGMCPDYGGRLWFVYDKVLGKEIIHRDYKEAKFYNAGMGYQYLGGGLELNIPNAHSHTNARKRECVIRNNPDGSVSLVMSNTEKIGRLHWSVAFTLEPGEARIRQDVRLANENLLEERYLYWANCGIPVNGNTEFIYPENRGALHGRYENAVSWPIYANKNLAFLRNIDEAVGFYMLNAREGYMGYYNHDENFGLVHYADVNDLPGKKYWSWGWHPTGQNQKYSHAEGVDYGEIQSGRIVIQEKFNRILPMTEMEYRHYWYPVGNIGSFNGASENAAVHFSIKDIKGNRARAVIKIQANRKYENPVVLIKENDEVIKKIPLKELTPETPASLTENISIKDGDWDAVWLYIVDQDHKPIVHVLPPKKKPEKFDSYLTPKKLKEKKAEDFTAEGLYAQAEVLLNDWFYHIPEIKKILKQVLTVDPGFSKAHIELGLFDLRGGDFEAAIKHFDKALKRDPNNGRALYYKGLAYRFTGNLQEATFFLRQSGRFGFEYAERIAEAEMAIGINDLALASTHLDRALQLNQTILKAYIYKAIIEKRRNHDRQAVDLIAMIRKMDAENVFTTCSDYIVSDFPAEKAKQIQKRYERDPDELLEVVATLYGAGFKDEAFEIVMLIDKTNPIIHLYRETLAQETDHALTQVVRKKTVANDFAWRLEEYFILQKKIREQPDRGELYYHLGNFLFAHNFIEEGINNWEKAKSLGYNDKIMLVSLYRAYHKAREMDKAYAYLNEAYALDNRDPYIFDYYVREIKEVEGAKKAIELMEANYNKFPDCYTLKTNLMNAYLNEGEFDKLEKLLKRSKLHDMHRVNYGDFWFELKMAKGYNKLKEGKYKEALKDFTVATEVPQNVAQHFMAAYSSQARRLFYLGYCNAKLGDETKARQYWEDALKLKRISRFEPGYRFDEIRTIYYQNFCLKALGRPDEARVYIMVIEDFANSFDNLNNEGLRKVCLMLSILGLDDPDNFAKWDSDLGLKHMKIEFNAPEE